MIHQSKTPIFLINPDSAERKGEDSNGILFQNHPGSKMDSGTNNMKGVRNWAGDLFWPLVIFLRVLGQSPLSFTTSSSNQNKKRQEKARAKNFVITSDSTISPHPVYTLDTREYKDDTDDIEEVNDEEKRKEYRVLFTSILTLVSVLCGFISAFNWFSITLDMALGKDRIGVGFSFNMWWSSMRGVFQKFMTRGLTNSTMKEKDIQQNISSISESVKIAMTLIPLSQLLELICAWIETGLFARFLNNWTVFQQEYHLTFHFYDQLEHSSLIFQRNLLLFYYAGLPTIAILVATPFLTEYINMKSLIWCLIIMVPFTLHTITANLLEDIKVIMTYRVTADAFLQIKNGMTYSMKWEKLTAEKVKAWRGLVHKVRQQAVLAGRYQKTHQLILITLSMILITDLVFLLLNGPWELEGSWILFSLCLGYTIVLTGRIYIKILAADRITHNEALISKELTGINSSELAVQLEIKFLHDMIRQNPTTISFGNYVTLNKRLILGIASQVVTYLIVLMQFSQSKDST